MKRFKMWLRHLTGMNEGRPTFWKEDGKQYVGFDCECGKIHDVTEITDNDIDRILLKDLRIKIK